MYIDAGTLSTDTATLNFAFSGTFSRYWDVKVTQIPCGTNYMYDKSPFWCNSYVSFVANFCSQPSGCLQYTTSLSGRFTSFNFAGVNSAYQHLANQNYRFCVRQAQGKLGFPLHVLFWGVITKTFPGYCCIQWMVCSDTYSFNFNTAGSATFATGTTGTACGGDYLMIPRKITNKLK